MAIRSLNSSHIKLCCQLIASQKSKKKCVGFSLLELIIGMLFMTWALLGFLALNSSSKQGAMDAYFEFIGFQAAQEAIEVLESFGYRWLLTRYMEPNVNPLSEYPKREWHNVIPKENFYYPEEVGYFDRWIEVEKISSGESNAIRITVKVKPKGQSKAMAYLNSSKNISLSTLVFEQPL
ncbi:hypothetical protein HYY75_05580 [bacterium]|nr:hypothetical protein [bacterium]